MRKPRFPVLLLLLLAGWFLGGVARAADLTVDITDIRDDRGSIDVTLYDRAQGWLDDSHAVGNLTLTAHPGTVRAVFQHLKPGRYAVVTSHDENGNGRMDFDIFGLPIEGYAFSRDVRPFLSAPSFDRAAIELGPSGGCIAIRMIYPFAGKFSSGRR